MLIPWMTTQKLVWTVWQIAKDCWKMHGHAWTRSLREYVRTVMDDHRINRAEANVPEIGEIVLIVGDA